MSQLIGRTFMKRFVGYGVWECTLTGFDADDETWSGRYSDGTVETYTRAQIEKFLGPVEPSGAAKALKAAKKTRAKQHAQKASAKPVLSSPINPSRPTRTPPTTGAASSSSSAAAAAAADAAKDPVAAGASHILSSKRRRKKRFTVVDGHTILKANNYGLEQGIATFSGSAASQRRRALPKIRSAQNAYNIFMVRNGLHLGNASERWRKVSATERAMFSQLAAEDKLRFQRETAEREALLDKLAQEDARDAIKRADDELDAERNAAQAAAAKAAARKRAKANNPGRRPSSQSRS